MTCTYNLNPSVWYNPTDELHLKIESPEAQALIRKGHEAYRVFANRYRHRLNLNQDESIAQTYIAAKEEGIFDLAQTLRQAFFAKDMHFYGVSYLWDICTESCVYCPAAIENRRKAKYKPRSLSIDEAVKDVHYVMQDGHRHMCILTGEEPVKHSPQVLAEYIRAFDGLGLKEIILNVEPPSNVKHFELWRNAARHTALQFRVFQETYHRETYAKIHPATKYGRKHDYDARYFSQEHALAYGFNSVGLGVLFGNHYLPIEEIDALSLHAYYLQDKTGKLPARICLPSAKHLESIEVAIPCSLPSTIVNSQRKLPAYWMFSELVYALARLAMPCVNIVSSERDGPALLEKLDKYASCTTLNVHPGVGDNIRFHEKDSAKELHFEQSPTFARPPGATMASLKLRGYRPWLAIKEAN